MLLTTHPSRSNSARMTTIQPNQLQQGQVSFVSHLCTGLPAVLLQYGAKAGTAFGKLMFAADPGSAADDLAAALKWAEGEASSEGPYFMGKDFTLVSTC